MAFKSIIDDRPTAQQIQVQNEQQRRESVLTERTGFEIEKDTAKVSQILQIATGNKSLKVAFIHKGGCLIYIAISKNPHEQVTYLRKQL